MIPIPGPNARLAATAIVAPLQAATRSRRPTISPTASPIIAAGKTTSSPKRDGSGIWPPMVAPARVARFHGIQVEPIAAIQ